MNLDAMSATPATWLFHPYLGIDIITPPDLIDQPMFDRGTILSLDDAKGFGRHFPFAKDAEKLEEYEFLIPILGSTGHTSTVTAALLARGYGKTDKEIEETALARVQELAAALAIVFYARSDFREAPALPEHTWSSGWHTHILVGAERGVQSHTDKRSARSAPLDMPDLKLTLTREDLLSILRCKQFAAFSDLLLFPCKPEKRAFRSVASAAANTLNRTINANSPEHQLLGAITVLEMLVSKHRPSIPANNAEQTDAELAEERTPFKTIAARVRALVGTAAYDHFAIDNTFRLRHAVVHRGHEVSWGEARHAGLIATLALLTYANASQKFSSPTELFSYLDFEAERPRLAQTYRHAAISWNGPTTEGCFPDHVPFRLARFGYTANRQYERYSEDQQSQEVAELVIAYARKRGIGIELAWDSIRPSVLGYPNPFDDAAAVERYYNENRQAVDDGATKLLDLFHKYQWRYD